MHRRMRLAAVAALLATLMVAGPVHADTPPGPDLYDVYVVGTAFTFRADGIDWSGIGQIEEERLSGTQNVSFFFAGQGALQTCDAGTPDDPSDDFENATSYEFFATSWRSKRFEVRTDLKNSTLSVDLTGQRVTIAPCTGELVASVTERHAFEFDIKATGPGRTEIRTAGGLTDFFQIRPGQADARVDHKAVATTDASLQHASLLPA